MKNNAIYSTKKINIKLQLILDKNISLPRMTKIYWVVSLSSSDQTTAYLLTLEDLLFGAIIMGVPSSSFGIFRLRLGVVGVSSTVKTSLRLADIRMGFCSSLAASTIGCGRIGDDSGPLGEVTDNNKSEAQSIQKYR